MSESYRVAVAGCHRMLEKRVANHNWAAAVAAVPACQVVAVFDHDLATRQAFVDCWGAMPAFSHYQQMLDEVRPDIVCVATRQTMHADQIEAAAAGHVRGILCEKPLATSMQETQRIVAACRRHGVAFSYGLDRRWFPYHRMLIDLIRSGAIGDVRAIVAFGLSSLLFQGCHWFDRVLEMAGDPEIAWVTGQVHWAATTTAEPNRRLDPAGSCHVQFANGVEAFVSPASSSRSFDLGVDVVGSRGRLVVLGEGAATSLWSVGDDDSTPVARPVPAVASTPPGPLVVQDLIQAMEQQRPTRCDLSCARRATELTFAVHQSSREGGRRVTPEEIDPSLRIPSMPWGNE
ncbi:MAG TPA: Gfo/Idh/MocA family oxidoreductase [Chloroflexota bacterium]|nr:Gfo/Idh/MocA family oxidoreductase [Chloroflexota bacterium]